MSRLCSLRLTNMFYCPCVNVPTATSNGASREVIFCIAKLMEFSGRMWFIYNATKERFNISSMFLSTRFICFNSFYIQLLELIIKHSSLFSSTSCLNTILSFLHSVSLSEFQCRFSWVDLLGVSEHLNVCVLWMKLVLELLILIQLSTAGFKVIRAIAHILIKVS
jgi:hypothetical protein